MDNLQIPLNLTLAEVNAVLGHLGKGSFEQVVGLINKIQNQARPTIAAAEAQAQMAANAATTAAAEAHKPSEAVAAEVSRANPPMRSRPNRKARRAAAVNGATPLEAASQPNGADRADTAQ